MRELLSGRASPCQGESRGFDPRLPLQVCLSKADQVCRDNHYSFVSLARIGHREGMPLVRSNSQLGSLTPLYFPIGACLGYNQSILSEYVGVALAIAAQVRYSARYICWRKCEGLG